MREIETINDFDECDEGEAIKVMGVEGNYGGREIEITGGMCCRTLDKLPIIVSQKDRNKISRTLIYLLNPSQKRKITGIAISEDLKPENKSFVYYKKIINRGN